MRTTIMIAYLTKWMQSRRLQLWSQSSQNNYSFIFEECDHVIIVLTKCIIYKDCDRDHSLHKNIMFLSLYRTVIMIAVFFIRTAIMIALLRKISYIWVFMRIAIMITVLKEDCDHSRNPHKNARLLSFVKTVIMIVVHYSPHKILYFWVF